MARTSFYRAAVVLAGLCLLAEVQAADPEISPLDRLFRLGSDLVENYVPQDMRAEGFFPPPEDWRNFWRDIEKILDSHSLEDLAAWQPAVAVALKYLEVRQEAQPAVAWLRQQMDYFNMAGMALQTPEKALPATVSPGTPSDRTAAARRAMLRSRKEWDKRLRSRAPPSAAASLIPALKTVFKSEGMPPEWVWIAEVESTMNPQAISPAGAAGLFQFMPETAMRFGLKLTPTDERYLPEKSARAAAQYLVFLYNRFESWPLVLAAYNAGEGRVGRLLSAQQGIRFEDIADSLPLETQMYVPKVLATVAVREKVEPDSLPAPKR